MITKILKLYYPVDRWIVNQKFGENLSTLYGKLGLLGHNGIDLHSIDGQAIRAAHDGVVVFADHDDASGLGITLRTNEMFNHHGIPTFYKTIYWHLKEGSIRVQPGQQVKTGQIIAGADNTGLSEGTHLHFGLKPVYRDEASFVWYNIEPDNGYKGAIDPNEFFTGEYAAVYCPQQQAVYGEDNSNVAVLQRKLAKLGYFTHFVTGYYGDITAQAVLAFQKDNQVASLLDLIWLRGRSFGPKSVEKINSLINTAI